MHASRIILDFLLKKCPSIHAKRRSLVAKVVDAGIKNGLSLLGLSRGLGSSTPLLNRIKSCDRLLSNAHLAKERLGLFRAMNESVIAQRQGIGVIVDWSDLREDRSAQLLRAAVIVKGRAFVVYEEVHPGEALGSVKVHRQFLKNLRLVLPQGCRPILVTDAGFRATWFQLALELQFDWVGRIRNRDLVRANGSTEWVGCKSLYALATGRAKNLGFFDYTRSNATACRLTVVKKPAKGRHQLTKFKEASRSSHTKKSQAAQTEPWLLATSLTLASISTKEIIALYAGRMQIEQTFRDIKNPQWGLGLSNSQTRKLHRLEALLLIGALITYALWLIGLAAKHSGCNVAYGSKKKARFTLSIHSLARHYLSETKPMRLLTRNIDNALSELTSMVFNVKI